MMPDSFNLHRVHSLDVYQPVKACFGKHGPPLEFRLPTMAHKETEVGIT